jgi:hypothetical protein
MILDCADLSSFVSWEDFVRLQHDFNEKDFDYIAMAEWITNVHINQAEGEPLNANNIRNMFRRGRFAKQTGSSGRPPSEVEKHAKERGKINNLYENGEIDAEECKRLHAENNKKYGVKA